jgi:uncharacterized membrane protein
MSELVVATYASENAAEHVLGVLRAHKVELPGDLDSSATVRTGADGGYTLTLADGPGTSDSFWGVLWEALFGLVFLVPASGIAYGSNLGGLFGAIDRAGLDAEFRASIREALGPRSSCLAVIATGWDPEAVLSEFLLRPSALLRAEVLLEQDSELMSELGGVPPGARSATPAT